MTAFEVVADSLRQLPPATVAGRVGGRKKKPRTIALLAGQTIFVPLNGESAAWVASRLSSAAVQHKKRSNTRVHEIDGVAGVVAWWTER